MTKSTPSQPPQPPKTDMEGAERGKTVVHHTICAPGEFPTGVEWCHQCRAGDAHGEVVRQSREGTTDCYQIACWFGHRWEMKIHWPPGELMRVEVKRYAT